MELARRRVAGEPLQYLIGTVGFRRLELAVGPGVFIPRPETELVVERAMARLPQRGTVVDVGTGSGAIALAIADERPDATVLATELSDEALAWAAKNRDDLGLSVDLYRGEWLDALPEAYRNAIDVVVANPPYVAFSEMETLPGDVVDHEPHGALFADAEGFAAIEAIAARAPAWLRPGGWLVMEIGDRHSQRTADLLATTGYRDIEIHKDLPGRERIAEARWV